MPTVRATWADLLEPGHKTPQEMIKDFLGKCPCGGEYSYYEFNKEKRAKCNKCGEEKVFYYGKLGDAS